MAVCGASFPSHAIRKQRSFPSSIKQEKLDKEAEVLYEIQFSDK